MTSSPELPVLLYDGLCGFCDGVVQFILARDRDGMLRFAPLQGEYARRVLERHPALRGVDSLVIVSPDVAGGGEHVAVRSDAALAIAGYLGGGWRAARLLRVVPRPVRDFGYDLFARMRYRVFGRLAQCRVPGGGGAGKVYRVGLQVLPATPSL